MMALLSWYCTCKIIMRVCRCVVHTKVHVLQPYMCKCYVCICMCACVHVCCVSVDMCIICICGIMSYSNHDFTYGMTCCESLLTEQVSWVLPKSKMVKHPPKESVQPVSSTVITDMWCSSSS